jgi:hypothetical protein
VQRARLLAYPPLGLSLETAMISEQTWDCGMQGKLKQSADRHSLDLPSEWGVVCCAQNGFDRASATDSGGTQWS